MKVGIVGSGFGLYGYLPAIVRGCGERVLLSERYRPRLLERQDVACLAGSIEWLRDETAVLDAATAVVIAKRPEDQVHLIDDCLARGHIERLLLEKPLAPSPEAAEPLIQRILAARKIFRIGYTFRYTRWFGELLSVLKKGSTSDPVKLRWRFRAHHHRTGIKTWKRHAAQGGGPIRFFGIHLIGLLAELGYDSVSASEISPVVGAEADCWRATFNGPALPAFDVEVETNAAADEFHLSCGELLIDLPDPFSTSSITGEFDRRVEALTELCSEFLYSEVQWLPWYQSSVRLWSEVESLTSFPRENSE
jgi:predicted dehydrogenase